MDSILKWKFAGSSLALGAAITFVITLLFLATGGWVGKTFGPFPPLYAVMVIPIVTGGFPLLLTVAAVYRLRKLAAARARVVVAAAVLLLAFVPVTPQWVWTNDSFVVVEGLAKRLAMEVWARLAVHLVPALFVGTACRVLTKSFQWKLVPVMAVLSALFTAVASDAAVAPLSRGPVLLALWQAVICSVWVGTLTAGAGFGLSAIRAR